MLASCPFCGGKAVAIITTRDAVAVNKTYFEDYRIGCMRCDVFIKGTSLCKLIGGRPIKLGDSSAETVRKSHYYAS